MPFKVSHGQLTWDRRISLKNPPILQSKSFMDYQSGCSFQFPLHRVLTDHGQQHRRSLQFKLWAQRKHLPGSLGRVLIRCVHWALPMCEALLWVLGSSSEPARHAPVPLTGNKKKTKYFIRLWSLLWMIQRSCRDRDQQERPTSERYFNFLFSGWLSYEMQAHRGRIQSVTITFLEQATVPGA